MKFCARHWESLRAAVDASGMGALVAESGDQAVSNLTRELQDGPTIDTFDPLMTAHNAIMSGAMAIIKDRYQQNPLMLMADDTEYPEWACPVCALNWCHVEHDRICTMEGCTYPTGHTYDEEAIEQGVAAARRTWGELNAL